jgi:hypothetical protein
MTGQYLPFWYYDVNQFGNKLEGAKKKGRNKDAAP